MYTETPGPKCNLAFNAQELDFLLSLVGNGFLKCWQETRTGMLHVSHRRILHTQLTNMPLLMHGGALPMLLKSKPFLPSIF